MDMVIVEALAAAGFAGLGFAARGRGMSVAKAPGIPPAGRLIGDLPRRHRRTARAIVSEAHDCLSRHADGTLEAYTAKETLRSYLPETLLAYLAVPRAARRESAAGGGPSPDDELRRQLSAVAAALERIRAADTSVAAQRMAANGAFLRERFGTPEPPRRSRRSTAWAHDAIEIIAGVVERRARR